jgi:predicted ATPase
MNIVLTGAPGGGKSTVLKLLGAQGFFVLPESYRWLRALISVEDWIPEARPRPLNQQEYFCHIGLQRFLEDAENTDVRFYDRSMIDVLAYCRAFDREDRAGIVEKFAKSTAASVHKAYLIQGSHSAQKQDWLRMEDRAMSMRILASIEETYQHFGVALVRLNNDDADVTLRTILQDLGMA